ncbi:MAG TPA: sigma-70 family RNA polymerase sigma factor [Anaerolineales bacterium]|nr:sigma-70 family RNA polymerase sigma factor [Anaerolineales bacterium]
METDITLLNAVRELNQEALVKIFDLYSAALYNYALRVCGDHIMADHIVGDVFVKLLDQLSVGNGPSTNLRSYLYQTAHHLIIDQARSSRHTIPLEAADWLRPDLHSSILGLENRIMFERILNAIQSDITEDQRHVVILRYLEGFSLRETAAIMGLTVAHVKVIQNRAIAKIRQALNYDEIMTTVACANVRKISKALGIRS